MEKRFLKKEGRSDRKSAAFLIYLARYPRLHCCKSFKSAEESECMSGKEKKDLFSNIISVPNFLHKFSIIRLIRGILVLVAQRKEIKHSQGSWEIK